MGAIRLKETQLFSDANLRALYELESNGNDSTANAFNMTPGGSPSYAAAMFGNGVTLPGIADSLIVNNDLGITGGACTIMFWVKLSADITSSAINFCQQNDAGTVVGHCVSYEYNAGTRRLFFRRSKWNVAHQGPTYNITLGTSWAHIAYTYDGSNVRGYVNGALVAGPTAASGNGSGGSSDNFTLQGSSVIGSLTHDDVAVFNRALSATEISDYYNGTYSNPTTNYLTNYRNRKRTPSLVSI